MVCSALCLFPHSSSTPGSLPSSIGYFSALKILILNDNNLWGEIPNVMNFSKLDAINLSNNRFVGALPSSLSQLPLLRVFRVNANQVVILALFWLWFVTVCSQLSRLPPNPFWPSLQEFVVRENLFAQVVFDMLFCRCCLKLFPLVFLFVL